MANTVTAQIKHKWADAAGKTQTFGFDVARGAVSAGNLNITTLTAHATAVLTGIEGLTDCEFGGASVILPLDVTIASPKANPDSQSSARRHAGMIYLGAAGENGRTELVTFHLPDPKPEFIDNSGNRPTMDSADADVTALNTQVIANVNTAGGEAVASYKGSFIRQRVTTPSSNQ
jgi:hypothetical protein